MSQEENRYERYRTGDLPWDTGSNATWLSRHGFQVTAVDVSVTAIQQAVKRASKAGVKCGFFTLDFMKDKIGGGPFGFVFDRGCFHSFDLAEERSRYAKGNMRYTKGIIGRMFLIKFDDGDIILKKIESFARKERVKAATLIFIGAFREKVFLVIEAVVFELKGIKAAKEIDPETGLNLLRI